MNYEFTEEKFKQRLAESLKRCPTKPFVHPTVTDAEMERDISYENDYKPVSEKDIAAIRAEIIKARTIEIPEGTKFILDDDEANQKWVKEQKEWHEKVRKDVEAMSDEDVIAWAKNANSSFRGMVENQKRDFELYKSVPLSETVAIDHEEDKAFIEKMKTLTPDQQRRRFLRITNPKRKRGDPISKEPKMFQEMLRMSVTVRQKMDFDKMNKLELKTRLIQTIAASAIQASDMQCRLSEEEERLNKYVDDRYFEKLAFNRFFNEHPELRKEYEKIFDSYKKARDESTVVVSGPEGRKLEIKQVGTAG